MPPLIKIIPKLLIALPAIKKWIDELIEDNREAIKSVASFDFPRIKKVFPKVFLEKAKVVAVKTKVPFPPLSSIGLTELKGMESMDIAGITSAQSSFCALIDAFNT